MTAPALLRKQDLTRAAEVAKSTGCRLEIKVGDAVITIIPDAPPAKEAGIDYSRPVL